MNDFLLRMILRQILRAPAGEGGGGDGGGDGADDTPPPGDAPPAGDAPPPVGKWWEASDYTPEEQQWLAARGLADADVTKVIPKLVKGHRSAEQRIGKGLDSIIDKPAKGQKTSEWMRANAAVFGLPEAEDGYAVQPPDFWPKDLPWDAELEGNARKLAFEAGVPPDVHQAYVGLFAQKMKDLDTASAQMLSAATDAMMGDLRKEHGDQTPAVIAKSRMGAQALAEAAGLDAPAIERVGQLLADKTGDAQVIRMFAAFADMMGEDKGIGLNKGGSLTMTPAEARSELSAFEGPDGEYGKAMASGNAAKLRELGPRRVQLSKIAART